MVLLYSRLNKSPFFLIGKSRRLVI